MSTVRKRRGVRPRRFSKAEYYRLGELGFFRGQRVELIEGQIGAPFIRLNPWTRMPSQT